MGLIPLPSKIGKRIRLRNHLTKFFEGWEYQMPGTYATAFRELLLENYHEYSAFSDINMPLWINQMVDVLPDDSYFLNYPQFYLPITADKPKIILLKDLEIQSFLGITWPKSYYGAYDNGSNMILVNMSMCLNNPLEGLITIIHEYAHKTSMNARVLPDGPIWLGEMIWDDLFGPDNPPEYTDWFIGDRSNLHIRLTAYGSERDIGNIEHYASSASQQVAEVFVRMKANVAVNNKYHDLNSLFEDKVDDFFTPLFQEYAKIFAWAENKTPKIDIPTSSWFSVFD